MWCGFVLFSAILQKLAFQLTPFPGFVMPEYFASMARGSWYSIVHTRGPASSGSTTCGRECAIRMDRISSAEGLTEWKPSRGVPPQLISRLKYLSGFVVSGQKKNSTAASFHTGPPVCVVI